MAPDLYIVNGIGFGSMVILLTVVVKVVRGLDHELRRLHVKIAETNGKLAVLDNGLRRVEADVKALWRRWDEGPGLGRRVHHRDVSGG